MVNVIGPLFSLAASGTFGKALFYYDTKYGARVRRPKSRFVPPGNIWVVNQGWFNLASQRWKTFSTVVQKAWKMIYAEACDTQRDIFMGQQIAAWNLSPENMITWPDIEVEDITAPIIGLYYNPDPLFWIFVIRTTDASLTKLRIPGIRYYNSDSNIVCSESDFVEETAMRKFETAKTKYTKHYIWYRFYRANGSLLPLTYGFYVE